MRELAVPPLTTMQDSGGLADVVYRNAEQAPNDVAFRRKVGGAWRDVTAEQFLTEVTDVAKGLVASGVGPGDRIAILSANCYEWTLFDFAIWAAGAASVPIYVTSSAEQVEWILSDSGAVGVVAENASLAERVDGVRDKLSDLKQVWRLDDKAVDTLVEAGKDIEDEVLKERRANVRPDDLATLIYTSGTTGRPKGVVLTHRNLYSACANAVEYLTELFKGEGPLDDASTLLFLPLAHVFGRMVEIAAVIGRSTLGHWADVKTLTDNLAAFKPTFILSVPYVLEKVYNGARQKAHSSGKGRIFDLAAATAIAHSEANGNASLGLKIKHTVFDRLVYSKLRAALGGQVKYAISGGAALGLRLTHFFRGVGITVLEGYGLTESSAASVVNTPTLVKPGTVGKPLPGTAVRISDEGEIQLKGDGIFTRYWQNDAATSEAIRDGWFSTGDLGELDDDGYLKITGRKKEILVTSGGKNVAPSVIEDRIAAHPLVGQALVVGDGQKYIAALITIDADYFGYWKSTTGKDEGATVSDLADDPDLTAEIQKAVDEGNLAVSKAESVRKFRILDTEFNPENGYLTPSLKLKRNIIMKDFAKEVDSLYS
jgi:long-chain acyl-CoA synthetase